MKEAVELWNDWKHVEWWDKQPPKYNKDGKTVCQRWQTWKKKESNTLNKNHFNVKSTKHLSWLFYENLFKVEIIEAPKEVNGKVSFYDRGKARLLIDGRDHTIQLTTKGSLPMDKHVLPLFGKVGKSLLQYNEIDKELQYVTACLDLSQTGTLHPNFKVPGTVTGRLSGGMET